MNALHRRLLYALAVVALISITAMHLSSTYTTFSGTYDEPFHIAAGMEWLDKGTYTYEVQQPPAARVAVALGLYWSGVRSHALPDFLDEGNAILQSGRGYRRNLALARLGNLPFLFLACAVVFLWARCWFTPIAAMWSLLLFLSLPAILGHAALATLDMACAATLAAALFALLAWVGHPVWWRSVVLGVTLALAVLSKFSNIAFLAVCCLALLVCLWPRWFRQSVRLRFGQACLAGGVALLTMWAGYRFSLAPISDHVDSHYLAGVWFARSPWVQRTFSKFLERPIPLGQLARGVWILYLHNKAGADSYLFGQYRATGWWYFFPVVLAVKTPLGFLILALVGLLLILSRFRRETWQRTATALFPIAIFLFCMTSHIDLGVRNILAVYPFLAVLAGHALWGAFQNRRARAIPVIAVLLVCTVVADTWRAHPDYLAYFNQLAGSHPERILAESDLDWGQDLFRLGPRLKALGVERVSVAYFGTAPLDLAGLPPYRVLGENEKATGHVAVSIRNVTLEFASSGAYGWLRSQTPLERVGKSIFLYCIDCPVTIRNSDPGLSVR